jgi:predicted lipoprotein with Yx(FWY)xxD motif
MRVRLTGARWYLALPLGAALALAGFLATGAIAQPSATAMCTASGHTIALCRTNLGRVLVNSNGHTLYMFERDKGGKSTCYTGCATVWRPLLKPGMVTLGPGVKRSLLGTTRRRNGTRQLTYNKHPLYTYKLDTRAGQTSGEGSTLFGAKWWALSATGKAVIKMTTTTTGTTTTPTTTTTPY